MVPSLNDNHAIRILLISLGMGQKDGPLLSKPNLVIDVVNRPCLHVLHLVSERQGQNPGEVGFFCFRRCSKTDGFSVLLNI